MGVQFKETKLKDVMICEVDAYPDHRGFFVEAYHHEKYRDGGIHQSFVQDNFSHSLQNVLRGMHYQLHHPQDKLILAMQGAIFDVAVDIRKGSPTFGQWASCILSRENRRQLFIPAGYAHGFCVLSESADVLYKCSDVYHPDDDFGIHWADDSVGIDWPVFEPVISDKDKDLPTLSEISPELLPEYTPPT